MAENEPTEVKPDEVVLSPKAGDESPKVVPSEGTVGQIKNTKSFSRRERDWAATRGASPAARNFRKRVKHAQLLVISVAKVAEENKIGEPPTGWFRDVALCLQQGIVSEAGRFSPTSSQKSCPKGFSAAEPELFGRVRTACGVPPARFAACMGLQEGQTDPSLRLVGTAAASGKSGAFFLLSPDQQCIAKSCTNEDWDTLLRILPDYVARLEAAREKADNQPRHSAAGLESLPTGAGWLETLLPRYLGLYTLVGIGSGPQEVKVLVMANVFSGSRKIHRRYDLKGSTIGRLASAKELNKASPVLKDLDWARAERPLSLTESTRSRVLEALQEDVCCLQKWGLMDYSLLLGIHDIEKEEQSRYEAMNVVYVRDSSRLCYLGVVDILTRYGWRKWTETMIMGRLQCGSDISCQHPEYYGNRFLRFVQENVVVGAE